MNIWKAPYIYPSISFLSKNGKNMFYLFLKVGGCLLVLVIVRSLSLLTLKCQDIANLH
jgi:hypothetical protein